MRVGSRLLSLNHINIWTLFISKCGYIFTTWGVSLSLLLIKWVRIAWIGFFGFTDSQIFQTDYSPTKGHLPRNFATLGDIFRIFCGKIFLQFNKNYLAFPMTNCLVFKSSGNRLLYHGSTKNLMYTFVFFQCEFYSLISPKPCQILRVCVRRHSYCYLRKTTTVVCRRKPSWHLLHAEVSLTLYMPLFFSRSSHPSYVSCGITYLWEHLNDAVPTHTSSPFWFETEASFAVRTLHIVSLNRDIFQMFCYQVFSWIDSFIIAIFHRVKWVVINTNQFFQHLARFFCATQRSCL